MQRRAGQDAKRQFLHEYEDTEDQVDGLENGERFYCQVEVLGEEVPEYLRPEEAFDSGCDLVCRM